LAVCFVVFAVPLDFLSLGMRMRVNEELPEDRQVPGWPRNYRRVEQIYGEQHPNSVIPGLSLYGRYTTLGLMGAIILLAITSRS
jgi:hypothetical protein